MCHEVSVVCILYFFTIEDCVYVKILRMQKTKEFIVRDHLNYFMENYYRDILPVLSSLFIYKQAKQSDP